MITKGIVEEIIDNYFVKVRIPVLDKAQNALQSTPTNNLPTATVCTVPNCRPNLRQGDIVFVGFEDNSLIQPIILGCLYKENLTNSLIDLNVNSLSVLVDTKLSRNTTIGDVTADNIQSLTGLNGNVQYQLERLETRLRALEQIHDIRGN